MAQYQQSGGQPGLNPGMMQPGMMQPGMMQPGMMQPGMMSQGMEGMGISGPQGGDMIDPSLMQPPPYIQGGMPPGMMQPGMMQPGMMQPGMMQPNMMQPPPPPTYARSSDRGDDDFLLTFLFKGPLLICVVTFIVLLLPISSWLRNLVPNGGNSSVLVAGTQAVASAGFWTLIHFII